MKWLPLALLAIHLVLFVFTALYIDASSDGQAPLLWAFWLPIDAPFGLVYALPIRVLEPIDAFVYLPYLIHGVIGPLWWYGIGKLVVRLLHAFSRRWRR